MSIIENEGNIQEEYSNCYITTVICHLLEISDECKILQKFREFRVEILQKNPQYIPFLYEYDFVGPQIASELLAGFTKENKIEFVIQIFNFYILPIFSYLERKDYQSAFVRYYEMIQVLENYCDIRLPEMSFKDSDIGQGLLYLSRIRRYFLYF